MIRKVKNTGSLRARGKAVAVCLVVLAIVAVITAGNALGVPGLKAIEIPGMGWVVGEAGTPQADIDAAVQNAKANDFLTDAELARELQAEERAERTRPSLEAFDDSGDAATIAEIRERAPELLREHGAVQQIDVPIADVAPRLRRIFTAAAVGRQISEIVAALRDQRAHITELVSFTDVRVTVDEWRGVRVGSERAVTVLKGRQGLLFKDGWDEREYIWRLDLLKEDGVWKIARMTFDDLQT